MDLQQSSRTRLLDGCGPALDRIGLQARIILFMALCAITACLSLLAGSKLMNGQIATVSFDMEVSAGNAAELFVNSFSRAPGHVALTPGQRRLYTFGGISQDIRMMRLDPSDTPAATVTIFGMVVSDNDGVIRRFSPADITRWGPQNLNQIELGADFVKYQATSNDPLLMTGEVVLLRQLLPGWLTTLLRDAASYQFFLPLVVLGFVLLTGVGLLEPDRRLHLPVALGVFVLALLVLPWLTVAAAGLAPVGQAVGRAGFLGLSTRGSSIAVLTMLAGTVMLAAAAAFVIRSGSGHSGQVHPDTDAAVAPVPRLSTTLSRLTMSVGVVTVLLLLVPDLGQHLDRLASAPYSPDWDGNNIRIWEWLIHEGYRPLIDYWFPYGAMYLFDLPAPWGLLTLTLYRMWIYVTAFVLLNGLTGRPLVALALVALIQLGDVSGYFPAGTRYMMPLLVALSYLLIDGRPERLSGGMNSRGLFWLNCVLVAIIEPVQLLYAAPPVAAKLGLDIFQARQLTVQGVVSQLLKDFAVPALVAVIYFGILIGLGQGRGLADFYLGLGDASNSSAEAPSLVRELTEPFTIQFLILLAPFVLLGIGLLERLRAGRSDHFADTMMAIGLIGFMLLQKHLVRSMGWQMFIIPGLGFALYLSLWRGRSGISTRAVAGVVVGAGIAVLIQIGGLTTLWSTVTTGPDRLARSIRLLADPGTRITDANAMSFASAKFDRFPQEQEVVADLAKHAPDGRVQRFFVLGDSPILYILAGWPPPYHVNDYNASPIYEQRKVVDFLNQDKPEVVVWDPATKSFDLFQSAVRNPLIYNTVIASYVPDRTVGRFEILRRRTVGDPLALDFWRDRLGQVIDYGHFPRVSSFRRLAPCPGATAACDAFLIVTKENPDYAGTLSVGVMAEGRSFEILMQTVAGERELPVSLSRLWFWGPLEADGLKPSLVPMAPSSGLSLSIQWAAARPDILY